MKTLKFRTILAVLLLFGLNAKTNGQNPDHLRVAHYQLACKPEDVDANIERVVSGVREAASENIDIISFPESFLTGYFMQADRARKHSLRIDGPEIKGLLEKTSHYATTFIVGLNELRGNELYNTAIIAEQGKCLGRYSKVFCMDYFTPGLEFPVFEKKGVKFGVIICADGGFIEPARILALKGAQIIFAPHYNYIRKEGLINHFQKVRADHIARAAENAVWFFRGNSVTKGYDKGLAFEGVGYGDSYLLDPLGEIVVRSQRHVECMITARIDVGSSLREKPFFDKAGSDSLKSAKALGPLLMQILDEIESQKKGTLQKERAE
ncbi:MAG: carbon-nitrogen hydrolase family protein [Phycisphaerales bacterium]|nr:MAG: carbon-nitrogen hydrolase family protein [Phycisphaerales bacterium]